jgi:hypothetical protein
LPPGFIENSRGCQHYSQQEEYLFRFTREIIIDVASSCRVVNDVAAAIVDIVADSGVAVVLKDEKNGKALSPVETDPRLW